MKIFIALLLLLGNVYIHAQSNYNELFTRGEEFRSKGLYTKALPYYEKAEKVVKANSHKLALWRVMAESYKETADYNKSRCTTSKYSIRSKTFLTKTTSY